MVRVRPSGFRERIERHLDDGEWDVVCRKRNGGYTLLWADDEEPFARLRPTGDEDDVEVFWWNGERWRAVGEFGRVLPLNEALDFVFEDPAGVFRIGGSIDEEDEDGVPLGHSLAGSAFGVVFGAAMLAGFLGGALGVMLSGAGYGLGGGAISGYLVFGLMSWRVSGWRLALRVSLVLGMPAVAAGAVGGSLGAALNQAVVTEWWGRFAGLLVGGLAGLLLFSGRPVTRVLSFLAGIALGLWLAGILSIGHVQWACLLTALVAGGSSELCGWIGRCPTVTIGRAAACAEAEQSRSKHGCASGSKRG